MNRHKRWKAVGVTLAVLTGLAGSKAYAATGTVDATITVTPVSAVSLAIAPTTYAYGQLDVNTSSVSATALRLTNNSLNSVTIEKHIETESSPAGWTASVAAAGSDQYMLLVATAAARPLTTAFENGRHAMAVGSANKDPLYGASGAGPTPTLAASGDFVDLWFKLVMPTDVTNVLAREIKVQFTGTAL